MVTRIESLLEPSDTPTKWCNQCKKDLPIDSFYSIVKKGKNKPYSECKKCNIARSEKWILDNKNSVKKRLQVYRAKHRDRLTETYKTWVENNPDAARRGHLKSYGLTLEQYATLSISQNNVCAVCGKSETRKIKSAVCSLSIDHDHSCCAGIKSCGKCVRGLLCSKCNTALGLLNDSPEIIRKLMDYAVRTRGGKNG